jgi:DNA polymerase sigma
MLLLLLLLLLLQVKLWAEVHGLNDPKAGTLNSWSLTQMVGGG